MKRSDPLRSDPDKLRAWQQRSRATALRKKSERTRDFSGEEAHRSTQGLQRPGRLRQRSMRKKDRYDAIAAASREALERDGHRCQAVDLLPAICCAGRLEAHHVAPRSTSPELVAESANIVGLCASHHAYVTDHPSETWALGLHAFSGDTIGETQATRDHARRIGL